MLMRVALINPANSNDIQSFRWGVGHLGLAYIAAVLEKSGHTVSVIDGKAEKLSPKSIASRVVESKSLIAGITAMTHEIYLAHEIACEIKRHNPGIRVIVGGPHTSALPERTLEEFEAFDVAVSGEGEITMLEIVECFASGDDADLGKVRGISYRQNNEIYRNPLREFMSSEDLEELPFPAWHLFPEQGLPMFAGRGCPYRCKFCMRVLGNRVRIRSPENVVAEIRYLHDRFGKKHSWFQDETFGLKKQWTRKFLNKLAEFRSEKDLDWTWKANSRVNLADQEIYFQMSEQGCQGLDFGIESGNQAILKTICKDISLDKARHAIALARRAGMVTEAFFIIGHPNETYRTALDTIRFAARLRADRIAVGVMVPYPGTEIWEMARQNRGGYSLVSQDWRYYDKYFGQAIRLDRLSPNRLKVLQSICYLWFYLRNLRIVDLFRFSSQHSRAVVRMAGNLLGLRK